MGKIVEPDLGPFDVYINDFFELDTCRSGMTNGPIPFTDIYNFATIKGEDVEEFTYLMRRLDKVMINHRDKDGPAKPSQTNNSQKQS